MLYCPGNGQELLSALGVTLLLHASNDFLLFKGPITWQISARAEISARFLEQIFFKRRLRLLEESFSPG